MEMLLAQLHEGQGLSEMIEGRLAAAPSAALDELCATVAGLQDPEAFSPQAAAVIVAGLEAARDAAQSGGLSGDGRWTYRQERFSPAGTCLTLRRDSPDTVEAGFQLDNESRLHGLFYVLLGAPPEARESAYDLEPTPNGWNLRRWENNKETRFPLGTAGGLALWNPSPKVDYWDDLVPTGGPTLVSRPTSPNGVDQPGKPPSLPPPAGPRKPREAATGASHGTDGSPPTSREPRAATPSPAPSVVRCPSCGDTLEAGWRFCGRCGMPAPVPSVARCLSCGDALEAGARFCVRCGAPAPVPSVVRCPSCGVTVGAGVRFCGQCGEPVVPARGTERAT